MTGQVPRRLVGGVLAALGATLALAAAPGPAAAAPSPLPVVSSPQGGSIGIKLLDAPASLANDPRARVYIIDHVAPGTTIQRHIQVSNNSSAPQHLLLYGGAASITQGGWEADGGVGGNDLATWITLSPASVTLPAGGSFTALATIAVPADATASERYAVIWADLPPSAGAGQVGVASLVGIRVYLSVGPGGTPPSGFAIEWMEAVRTPQGPDLLVAVQNTGQRALDLTGEATLTGGPGTLSAGPFPAEERTVGIGDSAPVVIPLDPAIPSGTWTASVTLTSGLISHTATAVVSIPAGLQASPSPVTAKPVTPPAGRGSSGFLGLSGRSRELAVSGAGVLLLALLAWLLLSRRRRDDKAQPEASPQPAAMKEPAPAARRGGPRHRY